MGIACLLVVGDTPPALVGVSTVVARVAVHPTTVIVVSVYVLAGIGILSSLSVTGCALAGWLVGRLKGGWV